MQSLLQSLSNSNFDKFRVILVNNAKDESIKLDNLANSYSEIIEIHIVYNVKNTGYSGGNNLALSYIQEKELDGDILISNSDVLFNDCTIENLVNKLNDPKIGAVSPRIYNTNNEHIFDTIELNGFLQKYNKTNFSVSKTDYVPGCCFIVKRELIEEIGLFDDSFFMYWEEVDLSIRIRNQGLQLICATDSSIVRKENSNSSYIKSIKYSVRNSFLLNNKHNIGIFSHICYLFIMLILAVSKSFKLRKNEPLKSFFIGFYEGALNKFII